MCLISRIVVSHGERQSIRLIGTLPAEFLPRVLDEVDAVIDRMLETLGEGGRGKSGEIVKMPFVSGH